MKRIIELSNGTKMWFENKQLHRKYGPAIEKADGSVSWYLNGKSSSLNGHITAVDWDNTEEATMLKLKYM